MKVWFNKTFSSLHSALRLIRMGDTSKHFSLVVTSTHPHAAAGRQADRFDIEPSPLSEAAYVDWCVSYCQTHRIDIFVPGKAMTRITEQHERFEHVGTRVLSAASAHTLNLLHNKAVFYDQVRTDVAPAPESHSIHNLAEFDAAYAAIKDRHAVACIKPAQSVYGIGFRKIVESQSAFDLFINGDTYKIDLSSLRTMLAQREVLPELLVMEYLPGHEFSVDCLADQGDLKVAVARRKPLHDEIGQVIDPREDIQQACREIVHQFGLNGFINIQFREGKHGLRVLEVNPRMSGGIAMACLSGINLPLMGLLGFANGYGNFEMHPVRNGLRVGEANLAEVIE